MSQKQAHAAANGFVGDDDYENYDFEQEQRLYGEQEDISDEDDATEEAIDLDPKGVGWIQWMCALDGNEALVEVDSSFIKDVMFLKQMK